MDEEKNTLNDKIASDLGLNYDESVPVVIEEAEIVVHDSNDVEDEQLENDFDSARKTLKELEFQALAAIKEFQQIASESQSARSYEVISTLLKTTSDIAKDRIDIHGKKKKISEKDSQQNSNGSTINTNNANIIMASSSDILKQIKKDEE